MKHLSGKTKARLIFWGGLLLTYTIIFWGVGCADYFVLHPSQKAIKTTARSETLETSMGDLEVFSINSRFARLPNAETRAIVLEFIPNAGRAEYADLGADDWAFLPVEYISLNYPGYGATPGKATLTNVHKSALAAYDEIAAHAGGKPIFLSGMSLGSAAALYVAANRPVAGLVLQNPVPLKQLILGKFGWWNLWLFAGPVAFDIPKQLDSITNAKKVTAPAVFLLADLDTLVPPEYQRRIHDAYAGPKNTITFRGGHNDPVEGNAAMSQREALSWLWERQFGPFTPTTAPSSLPTTQPTTP